MSAASPPPPASRALSALAGQLILTGSITAHLDDGRLVTGLADVSPDATSAATGEMLIDVRTERVLAQAWRIFERLADELATHGAGLDDLLRLRIFLRDRRDLPAIERVMRQRIAAPWPPTSVIAMKPAGLNPELDVQIDAIALAPGPVTKHTIATSTPGATRPGYALATRAGQLVFASLVGVNTASGALAQTIDEIPGRHAEIEQFAFGEDHEQRVLAQSWFIFEQLQELLAQEGGSLSEVLKMNGWLAVSMRDYGPLINARRHYFEASGLPVSTGLSIEAVVPDGAELIYEVIALVSSDDGFEKEQLAPSTIGGFYTDAVKAGPYVLTCGEVPIDVTGPRVIATLADLPDGAGKGLVDGTIHAEGGVEARTWFVYERLRTHLDRFGAGLDDVVQQTVYLEKVEEYRAFETVARLVFGDTLPPTTVVPINDTSPFRAAEMEIDVIAFTGGAS